MKALYTLAGILLALLVVILIGNKYSNKSNNDEQLFSAGIAADTNTRENRTLNEEKVGEEFYAGKLEDERATTKNNTKPKVRVREERERTINKEDINEEITRLYGERDFITKEGKRWASYIVGQNTDGSKNDWLAYVVIRSWLTRELLGKTYTEDDFNRDLRGSLQYNWSINKILNDYPSLNVVKQGKAKLSSPPKYSDKKSRYVLDIDVSKDEIMANHASAVNSWVNQKESLNGTKVNFKVRTATEKQKSSARKKAEKMPRGKEVVFQDVGEYWDVAQQLISLESGFDSWDAYKKAVGRRVADEAFRTRTNIMANGGQMKLTRRK